jgi:N-acetylmuramoyl-L-alanine amidase
MQKCPLCEQEIKKQQLTGRVVALDVGHGYGSTALFDSGAVGNGTREYDLNARTASRAAEMLRSLGAIVHVFLYNDANVRLTLAQKGARAGEVNADVFVSIHHNAAEGGVAQGTETLVHSLAVREDEKLAAAIQARLVEALGYHDRGVKYQNLGVLKGCPTSVPACLTEGFFMNWKTFAGKIPADVQEAYATGLALGIRDYLNNERR